MTPGTRIGAYEIVSQLGAGGMGEVYRARDSKLKREVAIKVLPADVAGDRERLARFQREAEVLASLNHPNIAHVYGVEETALVMELVDGEDLSQRIARGPIPVDEALTIAKQIAEALEAAHDAGIVHRDLKPANIKVREDGTVKVLDFGLAKALDAGGREPEAASALANSPTITSPAMTQHGVILGTAAYMSPEQAKGKPVDKRADVWAFGCVIFEMLTGKKAFEGEDVTDTIVSVISKEPDWSKLPAGATPPPVLRLLRRCLAKDRKQRLGDLGVARLEIDEALGGTIDQSRTGEPPRRSRSLLAAVVGATAVVALAMGWASSPYFAPASPPPLPLRFEVDPGDNAAFTAFIVNFLAVSPDGRQLAYLAQSEPATPAEIWVRSFTDGSTRKIANTARAAGMFWAPDSRSLAFSSSGRLQRVDLATGNTQTIVDGVGVAGSWNRDGVILISADVIKQVPAAGGTPAAATVLDEAAGEVEHLIPNFLPDGKRFTFTAYRRDGTFALKMGELGRTDSRVIGDSPSGAQYMEPGYLIYARDARLWGRPFDPTRGEWTGDPVVIADAVRQLSAGSAGFSVSANGTIAYDSTSVFGLEVELVELSRGGVAERSLATINGIHTLSVSPDQRTLALEHSAGAMNAVWMMDVVRGTRSRFTFGEVTQGHPIWSPDGSQVAYFEGRPGTHTRLMIKPSAGTGNATPVSSSVNEPITSKQPTDWSVDGDILVYEEQTTSTNWDVKYVDLRGDRQPRAAIQTPAVERMGVLSPDARFIAYESNESGQREIYVSTFPKADRRWTISSGGGSKPRWTRKGRELLFMGGNGSLQSVTIDTSKDGIDAGIPQALPVSGAVDSDGFNYGVSPDGSKIFLMRRAPNARTHRLSVIMNWPASLPLAR